MLLRLRTAITAIVAVLFSIGMAMPAAADGILASTKPVQSLVAMVAGENVEVLIENESPHQVSLRPSHRRKIRDAEIVFIISPGFETFLARAIARHDNVVALAERSGINLMRSRGRHDDYDDDHDDYDDHDEYDDDHDDDHKDYDDHDDYDDHGHDHGSNEYRLWREPLIASVITITADDHDHRGEYDLHIWLDPLHATAMLAPIAGELGRLYPERAEEFNANAVAAAHRLFALHAELWRTLTPARGKGIIVFHDAFGYFQKRYGLNVRASVLDSHGGALSASRLREVEGLMAQGGIACIFTEPQFASSAAENLARKYGTGIAALDPLGNDIPSGADHYPAMMRQIARTVADCIA